MNSGWTIFDREKIVLGLGYAIILLEFLDAAFVVPGKTLASGHLCPLALVPLLPSLLRGSPSLGNVSVWLSIHPTLTFLCEVLKKLDLGLERWFRG